MLGDVDTKMFRTAVAPDVTQDAFLGGSLKILQPKKGFRAGIDSVLLGASINARTAKLLELGSGVGVASLTALTYFRHVEAIMAEISREAIDLCMANALGNRLLDRVNICEIDILSNGSCRERAGLKADFFDCVIANPPYFDNETVSLPEHGALAHAHPRECLEQWVRVAVSAAAAAAEVIFIHRAEAIGDLLRAYHRRLGDVTILPIASRPGQAANRVLLRGRKGSRAPVTLLPPLYLHGPTGRDFTEQVDKVLRGKSRLHW